MGRKKNEALVRDAEDHVANQKDILHPLLKDIYGQPVATLAFAELLDEIRQAKIYKFYNQDPVKGLLLSGPKGTGKTTCVRALANELEVAGIKSSLFHLSYMDIANAYIDRPIENLRAVFKFIDQLSQDSHVILFIDEIDSIFPAMNENTHESDRKRVNVFLEWIDGGIKSASNITAIAATNDIKAVHNSLLRPGRFDRIIEFTPLTASDIYDAIISKLKSIIPESDLNFDNIDKNEMTKILNKGYNGADANFIVTKIVKHFIKEHIQEISKSYVNLERITNAQLRKTKPKFNINKDLIESIIKDIKPSETRNRTLNIGFVK